MADSSSNFFSVSQKRQQQKIGSSLKQASPLLRLTWKFFVKTQKLKSNVEQGNEMY